MYACFCEIVGGFFAGVCRLEDRPPTFRDPPPPLLHSRINPGRYALVTVQVGVFGDLWI